MAVRKSVIRKATGRKQTKQAKRVDDPYRVNGVIIDLGKGLDDKKRKAAVATLLRDVPAFAALVGPKPKVEPMGTGSTDILARVPKGSAPSVQDAWSAVHALHRHELVADAEPAVRISAEPAEMPDKRVAKKSVGTTRHLPDSTPIDWSVKATNVDKVWLQNIFGKGVRIGHPDTGYTRHQEILGPRLLVAQGYNYEDKKPDALDPMSGKHPGHGTATASVIFSGTNANPHVHGIAREAELVPLRIADSVIHFDFSNLVQALYRARDQGCHVVSMSLGGPWAGRSLSRAVDQVINDGLILLAAAGNVWPWVVYPAKLDNVLAVAACNVKVKPWSKSASGSAVDITAPGESVWRAYTKKAGTAMTYTIERGSGTSYAVATTAGVCALWLQRHGVKSLQQRYGSRLASVFLQLVRANCKPVPGWNVHDYGPGVLDAVALLAAPLPAIGPAPARVAKSISKKSTTSSAAWARLQPYVPELSSTELAGAASTMFGAKKTIRKATVGRKQAVRPPSVVDEIEFHVATNRAVRDALVAAARPAGAARRMGAKGVRKTPVRKGVPGRSALQQVASPELKAMLGSH